MTVTPQTFSYLQLCMLESNEKWIEHGCNGAALGLLHSLGRKLMGLIKLNQKLEHFNDNKGKNSLIIQHENN